MAISYNNPSALPQGYGTGAGSSGNPLATGYAQHGILSSIDALPPDVSTKLFKRFGGQGLDILNLLIAQGAKRVVNNSNGSFHFEEDRYNQSITVSDSPTPAPSVTFEVSASSTSDSVRPYVVVGDLLIRMSDFTRYKVTNVSPATNPNDDYEVTVVNLAGGNVDLNAGEILAIYSSAFGEDTAQPDAKATYWSRFYAPMQRHKTSAKITGDALTDKVFPVMMDDGKTIKGFHSHLFAQHEYRHLLGLVGAMILGKAYDPSAFLTSGNMMNPDGYNDSNYAQGMVDTFTQRAVQGSWTDSGLANQSDLYDLIAGMKANWTGNDLIALFCRDLYQAFEQKISSGTSFLANTNIASTRQESAKVIFGDNQDFETMMSTFAFSTLTMNGKNLNVKSFDLSYDPTLFGAGETNAFTGMGFVMPAEKQADAAGLLRNTVELIYKSMDGEDRFMKVWDDGAASPRRLGPNDNYVIYMLTQFGFDWFKIEQCGLLMNDN
jgi:hypothetical protein